MGTLPGMALRLGDLSTSASLTFPPKERAEQRALSWVLPAVSRSVRVARAGGGGHAGSVAFTPLQEHTTLTACFSA